jgi:hypothetical protein
MPAFGTALVLWCRVMCNAPSPSPRAAFAALLLALASASTSVPASASEPSSPTAPPPASESFPARAYGDLDRAACLSALDERGVPYERYGHARGVETPVRLMGPLHGVRLLHADTSDWLASARREILDCRLVLALDDLAAIVAAHGVTTIRHFGVYRGDLPLPKHGRPLHHVAALAIDVAAFEKADGTRVEVLRDWRGGAGESATELRAILGDIVDAKLFHQVLTPRHDAKHRDHFHLEVMRGTSWTFVD